MDEFIKISSIEEYQKAISGKSIILFSATWCPDCAFIKPFIGEVARNNPEFKYYLIDRDQFIDLCKTLDVMGIPSFIAYEDGKETGRFVSKFRKTRAEIEEFINSVK